MNDYYDVSLKWDRLKKLKIYSNFEFYEKDISDASAVDSIVKRDMPEYIVNLAAQAGVRYSLENPRAYIASNVAGFTNILESAHRHGVRRVLYASSSSVYGMSTKETLSEADTTDCPVSLYAATKKTNEVIAYAYNHLYGMEIVGMRYFTVYGPWGRPDMAIHRFTKAIVQGDTIQLYNWGLSVRDFTFIADAIEGTLAIMDTHLSGGFDGDRSHPSSYVYNVAAGNPVVVKDLVTELETLLGKKADIIYLGEQPVDVRSTFADTTRLDALRPERKRTDIVTGLQEFIDWYQGYYQ